MIPLLLTLAFAQEPEAVEAPAPPESTADAEAPEAADAPETEAESEAPASEPVEESPPLAEAPPPPTSFERPADRVALWSLSAEIGSSRNDDDGFDIFGGRDALAVQGLRLCRRVRDRVELQAGWLQGRRGATVEVADPHGGREQSFQSAYDAHRFSLGARADVTLDDALFGYVAARGQLVLQRVRLDGDPNTRLNSDQLAESALAPGAELVGGIELRIPQGQMPLTVGWTLEMGTETVANASFGDLGDLRSGGFVIHSGLGVRF